ncbi:MAG: hypothetical protein U5K54_01490 [Cytophagales bacterium]|nr:hypothetical protein [Cytophagales bacterium]
MPPSAELEPAEKMVPYVDGEFEAVMSPVTRLLLASEIVPLLYTLPVMVTVPVVFTSLRLPIEPPVTVLQLVHLNCVSRTDCINGVPGSPGSGEQQQNLTFGVVELVDPW